ncbi:MAG: hypothetical protein FWD66_11415, partial [Paludibacter sp.]|nr:hypothetical protein [Paludibacter sp.]
PQEMYRIYQPAYTQYLKMIDLYNQIDSTGYEDLPTEYYAQWLKYISTQKEQARENKRMLFEKQTTKRIEGQKH